VSHNGIVYEKDLGPDTVKQFSVMDRQPGLDMDAGVGTLIHAHVLAAALSHR
jgi:hypothetical protein